MVQSSSISCESFEPLLFCFSATPSNKQRRTMMSSALKSPCTCAYHPRHVLPVEGGGLGELRLKVAMHLRVSSTSRSACGGRRAWGAWGAGGDLFQQISELFG